MLQNITQWTGLGDKQVLKHNALGETMDYFNHQFVDMHPKKKKKTYVVLYDDFSPDSLIGRFSMYTIFTMLTTLFFQLVLFNNEIRN